MEWQTIDSAPRDGQEFLACDVRQGGVVQLFSWNKLYECWQSKGEPMSDILIHWTHWTSIFNKPKREE